MNNICSWIIFYICSFPSMFLMYYISLMKRKWKEAGHISSLSFFFAFTITNVKCECYTHQTSNSNALFPYIKDINTFFFFFSKDYPSRKQMWNWIITVRTFIKSIIVQGRQKFRNLQRTLCWWTLLSMDRIMTFSKVFLHLRLKDINTQKNFQKSVFPVCTHD